MKSDKIKVLYITGWGRSGTTILDNILGQVEGFFSAGELRFVWDRNLVQNRLCGCGLSFSDCGFWKEVLAEAFGAPDRVDLHEMIRAQNEIGTRHLPLIVSPFREHLMGYRMKEYRQNLEKLYRAIGSVSESNVIVDSSKSPWYGYILGTLPIIDLYIVHLIRDSRGTAYSWLRKKTLPDKDNSTYMDRYNPIKSSIMWDAWNVAAEMFWGQSPDRYFMLRYEDFIQRPKASVEKILSLIQERSSALPFIRNYEVELGINHTTTGNPIRLKTGTVRLALDEEWKNRMKLLDKTIVTALTWPLLERYGYLGGRPHRWL